MGMNRTMCASYINYITGRMQFTFKRWTRSAAFIFSISQPPSRTCITTNRQQPKPKQNQMKLYQTEKNWTTKTEYIQIKQQPKREKVPTERKSDWWRSSVIANRISVSSISAYFVSASRKRNRYGRKDIGTETERRRDRETETERQRQRDYEKNRESILPAVRIAREWWWCRWRERGLRRRYCGWSSAVPCACAACPSAAPSDPTSS